MLRNKDEAPAVRVYTVCDESRYVIVRNVPALGCCNELSALFATYGEIEECKPMDEEDCEPFTDVYWIKFVHVNNARFAKRKLDESVFLGNRLQVSYATHFESPLDTKGKLECRRKEVLARLNPGRFRGSIAHNQETPFEPVVDPASGKVDSISKQINCKQMDYPGSQQTYHNMKPPITTVSSDKDYFPSPSMNKTVKLVRQKLDKIQSSSSHLEAGAAVKKARTDNRRRI